MQKIILEIGTLCKKVITSYVFIQAIIGSFLDVGKIHSYNLANNMGIFR